MATTKKTVSPRTSTKSNGKFTAEERAAMKERAKELKAQESRAAGEQALLEKIGELTGDDRKLAEQIHAIVAENAPALAPRTYYGMPAWAKDDTVLCFFQPASKFNSRYATFGFNDGAMIDEGAMWATSWAVTKLSAADEKKLAALVKKAAS